MAIAHKEIGRLIWEIYDNAAKSSEARKHAELSLSILGRHLPAQHLLLASSKNILGGILGVIAIDSQVGLMTSNILNSDRTACRTRLQWSRC